MILNSPCKIHLIINLLFQSIAMKFFGLFIVLLCIGSVFSLTITPYYIQVKETGNESLPSQNVSFQIDCDTKTLIITSNSDYGIPNPKAYLFNTNYGYSLFGTNQGQNGRVSLRASGNVNFLTALFILRVDSPGYRSKEIEFTFQKCFDGSPDESDSIIIPQEPVSPPIVVPESPPQVPPSTSSVPDSNESVLPPQLPITNPPASSNNSSSATIPSPSSSSGVCAMPFGLISFFLFFLHANRRRLSW